MDAREELKCDGDCEEHAGYIKKVRVWYGSKYWGIWNYCYNAINTNKKNGFTQEIVGDVE